MRFAKFLLNACCGNAKKQQSICFIICENIRLSKKKKKNILAEGSFIQLIATMGKGTLIPVIDKFIRTGNPELKEIIQSNKTA